MVPEKPGYICGPLTDLSEEDQESTKALYAQAADHIEGLLKKRPFVPHEHYDPIRHSQYTPPEVFAAEHEQVTLNSGFLVVFAIAPSWGGGMEVMMAEYTGIPVFLLQPKHKTVSRLLRGTPAIVTHIVYDNDHDAIEQLLEALHDYFIQPKFAAYGSEMLEQAS